jgi:5-amino-6-(5-phospho-D-ribitylamino)uracil phosphatase
LFCYNGCMRRKIFATDYDGTLFQYGTVSQKDIESIKRFRQSGGLFGIATGRMIASVKREIEIFDIPVDFIIGCNGAVTTDRFYNELHSFNIDNEIGLRVKSMLIDGGSERTSISDGYNVYSVGAISSDLERFFVARDVILANNIKGLYGRVATRDRAIELTNVINETYGDHVLALPNYNYIDIASSATDKAIALSKFIAPFDNPIVGTAGDAHNDLLMLKTFHGYVMSHGDPEVVSQIDNKVATLREALDAFMEI